MYIRSNKCKTIAQNKLHIKGIKDRFRLNQAFSSNDLAEFYRSIEPEVKKTTVNWRIFNLVQDGIINRIGRGKYTLGKEKAYIPDLSDRLISVYKKIRSDFPFLEICIWNTSVINEFMLHQPGKYYQLIEVEKDGMESIFYYLKNRKYSVYMEPSEELMRRYMIDEKEPWIVKSLVSEAPIQEIKGISTTTIEKLLVDIFCDPVIFNAQQGSEMNQIFNEAFDKYTINESKMLRYASRRRKKGELDNYLNETSKYRQQL